MQPKNTRVVFIISSDNSGKREVYQGIYEKLWVTLYDFVILDGSW